MHKFRYKHILLSFVLFFGAHHKLFPVSMCFDNVLRMMQESVVKKMPGSYHIQRLETACSHVSSDFSEMVAGFANGCFAKQKKIRQQFDALCKTIVKIDDGVKFAQDIRPWHVRWLSDKINDLEATASSLRSRLTNQDDFNLGFVVQSFARSFLYEILPCLSLYIGSTWQKAFDFFVRRPAEFYIRNWKWTIPTTIVVGNVGYDVAHYAENIKKAPSTWNIFKPLMKLKKSWYKWFVGTIGTGLFMSKLSHGVIATDEGVYVGEPVGLHLQGHEQEQWPPIQGDIRIRDVESALIWEARENFNMTNQPREINRNINVTIVAIPCICQQGLDCGFHTIFNAACFVNNDFELMQNRDLFGRHLHEWKMFLRGEEWINELIRHVAPERQEAYRSRIPKWQNGVCAHSTHLEAIINHFNFFHDRLSNEQQLLPNVSVVEGIWQVKEALKRAERYEYEVLSSNVENVATDIEHLQNGRQPEVLIPVGMNGQANLDAEPRRIDWRQQDELLQNIQNYRNNGADQIIILNTGHGHWIAVKLAQHEGRDYIFVADSAWNADQRHSHTIKQLYDIFKSDPIPQLQNIN